MPADPVQGAQQAINEGGLALRQALPGFVEEIVASRIWVSRKDRRGKPFRDLRAFVEHEQWEGLGLRYADLIRFCEDRPAVARLLKAEHAALSEPGAPEGNTNRANKVATVNVEDEPKGGNGSGYTMRRLKRDAPELFDRVVSGELSPNAAARAAGFRRTVVQVTNAHPHGTATRLIERFGREWALSLAAEIHAQAGTQ